MKELNKRKLFTSESVTEGHPDKVCDQVSDAILDAILAQDPNSRVACEACATTGLVMVMGEITTTGYVDIPKIVRSVVKEIGYDRGKYGFDADNLAVISTIDEQSPDIAMGVDNDGAGDQGLMFGFACDETEEMMPLPISLAHKLTKRLAFVRKSGLVNYLRPDGKSQVTVEYDENDVPVRVDSVVISTQHSENVELDELKAFIKKEVIDNVIAFATENGFSVLGLTYSPVKGPEGNIEYLAYMTTGDDASGSAENNEVLVEKVVTEAHDTL